MKDIDLYNFVKENNLEYIIEKMDFDNPKIWLHVPFNLLSKFSELLGYTFVADRPQDCIFCEKTIAFELTEILEYFCLEKFYFFDKNE